MPAAMKVAVVGAGISGIAAAHGLQHQCDVSLFEAERRIGGHTDTHAILTGGRTYRVDSGFIVYNRQNYPLFSAWLESLGVATRPSDMSFAVSNRLSGLEYGTADMRALFCQRYNLISPRFLSMLADLRRFYREAPAAARDDSLTLGEYLVHHGYGRAFIDDHMLPMCAALWSLPMDIALHVPVAHVVGFMAHHRMFQLEGRPEWRVVEGGSSSYLRAFAQRFRGRIRTGEAVHAIARRGHQVRVTSATGPHLFDAVVIACHSDQALALLEDPTPAEREVLGAITYQRNRAVVHSDPSVMPSRPAAWSSWNAVVDGARDRACRVTYWMNRLQTFDEDQPFFVSLNPDAPLENVWSEREYAHPVFSLEARQAQRRRNEISGVANVWYCGAYWGWGSHEDGFSSGAGVALKMQEAGSRAA